MISISVTGIPAVQQKIKGTIDPDKIKQELIRTGLEIEGTAKDYCPVDTGRLRSSISTNWDGSGKKHGDTGNHPDGESSDGVTEPKKQSGDIAVVRIGSNVKYAPYIEYGTQRMKPQPYLTPAVLEHIPNIGKNIRSALHK